MTDSARANHRDSQLAANRADSHSFHRSVGLFSATAIGRKEIREAFLETQQEHPGQAA
jgi:hypothetical protein